MDPDPLISHYRQRLDAALIHHLGAQGGNLSARIANVAHEVPEDLHALLRELATDPAGADVGADSAVAEFAFR